MSTEREFELSEVEERIAPSCLGGLIHGGVGADANVGASASGGIDAGFVQANYAANANVSAGAMVHF